MESKFKFNSQVCTSIDQSRRLLALGLKKETADCGIYYSELAGCDRMFAKIETEFDADEIPSWSLHRLLSMLPDDVPKIFWILDGVSITIVFEDDDSNFFPHKGDIYEGVVNCIEWLIKEGYFNKEYLCEK